MAKRNSNEATTAARAARRVVGRAMRVANLALKGRTPEQITAAFSLPQGEAPMWTHLVKTMGASIVRAEGQSPPVVNTSLNLVMISRADSVDEWNKMAEPYRRPQLGAVPIDVPAVGPVDTGAVTASRSGKKPA